MDIIAFRNKHNLGLIESKEALTYSKGNENLALAYIKAKTLAVDTPNLTFDERVQLFLSEK